MSDALGTGPKKVAVFARDVRDGSSVADAGFRLVAESSQGELQVVAELGTDHVGYASASVDPAELGDDVAHLWLEPLGSPAGRIDVLGQVRTVPTALSLNVELGELPGPPLTHRRTSLDAIDYELSPSSFGFGAEGVVVGEDACKRLVPGVADAFVQRFHQIERFAGGLYSGKAKLGERQFSVRVGRLLKYEAKWREPRYALGDALYTLPLAPCEDVKLAIVDWSREQTVSRIDRSRDAQALLHSQNRDRSIEDSVRAAVEESRSGFDGKGALGIGLNLGFISGSLGLGFGGFNRHGKRELSSNTVQSLSDALRLASSLIRERHATSVVQGKQAEVVGAETRRVRNHNACHALTVIYYQMVRNYLLETSYTGFEDLLFVTFPRIVFSAESAHLHRPVLRSVLLDPSLDECLNALDTVLCTALHEAPKPPPAETKQVWEGELEFQQFTLTIRTRDELWAGTDDYVKARLRLDDGSEVGLLHKGNDFLDNPGQDFEQGDQQAYNVRSGSAVKWQQLTHLGLETSRWRPTADQWRPLSVKLVAHHKRADFVLVDHEFAPSVKLTESAAWTRIKAPKPKPAAKKADTGGAGLAKAKCCVERLLVHLNHFRNYYSAAVHLARPVGDRIVELDQTTLSRQPLSDLVQPMPVGVFGDQLVFRPTDGPGARLLAGIKAAASGEWPADPKPEPATKQPISYPVRGAFAEVHLSHCSACAKRDPAISFDEFSTVCKETAAPEISKEMLATRKQDVTITTAAAPTAGWLTVPTPPAAPAPTNVGTLLGELIKSGLWRSEDLKGFGDAINKALDKLPAAQAPKKEEKKDDDKKKADDKKTDDKKTPEKKPDSGEGSKGDGPELIPVVLAETIGKLEARRAETFAALLSEAAASRLLATSPTRLHDVLTLLEGQHKEGRLSDEQLATAVRAVFGLRGEG